MQVTSLLSRHEPAALHAEEIGPKQDHYHEHIPVRIQHMLVGLIFVLNSLIIRWLFDNAEMLASTSALLGSLILTYPIVWMAYKDLRRGMLGVNELVAQVSKISDSAEKPLG